MEKDWYIFKDAILSGIDTSDCNDTVQGFCQRADTYQECLDICKGYPQCYYGYYVETPDGDNICVPLKAREQKTYPYRLRHKSYYPILDSMKTYVFLTDKYPYPPQIPNALFYGDTFFASIGKNPIGLTRKGINFTSNIDMQFLPSKISRSEVENYVTIKDGDEVIVSIPKTSYVLKETKDGVLDWQQQASLLSIPENIFIIHSKDKTSMNYSGQFYLEYKGKTVVFKDGSLRTSENIEQEDAMFFSLTPKVQAYYCDGECKSVSLDKTEMKGENAFFKGLPVYRNPVCWNLCSNTPKKSLPRFLLPLLLILLFLLSILLLFLKVL